MNTRQTYRARFPAATITLAELKRPVVAHHHHSAEYEALRREFRATEAAQQLPDDLADWPEFFLQSRLSVDTVSKLLSHGFAELWRHDSAGRSWIRLKPAFYSTVRKTKGY